MDVTENLYVEGLAKFHAWSRARRPLGVAGAVSFLTHALIAVLVMGILVRVPVTQPPIRVSLYEPPPPPPEGTANAAATISAPVRIPDAEPHPVVRKPDPSKHLALTRPHRLPPRQEPPRPIPAEPVLEAMPAPAVGAGQADGVAGGEPGGLVGGTVGGHGKTLLSADQAAHLPIPISEIKPEYPPIARLRGIEGQVVLEAIIARDGHIEPAITVIQSVPLLDRAAIDAVRQWRFRPALDRDGEPLRVTLRVPVRFVLR